MPETLLGIARLDSQLECIYSPFNVRGEGQWRTDEESVRDKRLPCDPLQIEEEKETVQSIFYLESFNRSSRQIDGTLGLLYVMIAKLRSVLTSFFLRNPIISFKKIIIRSLIDRVPESINSRPEKSALSCDKYTDTLQSGPEESE
ncbi:hypothetical protein CEXT_791681 [Caerostris extrusa]|uniref:Uncharacterized protein n=1 Tax=Caerostris extrusa TaxID=172846 RepID=A0AAV4X8D7_CAEEX|nr:hypothetical protein CEXT_791681 [Caerostris extrusa]